MKKRLWKFLALLMTLVLLPACTSNNRQGQESEQIEASDQVSESEEIESETEDTSQEADTEAGDTDSGEASEETSQPADKEKKTLKLGAMTGPTGIAVLNLADMASQDLTSYGYDFEIVSSPDELVSLLAKEELDLAIVPANLASVLYNNPEMDIQVLSTNNLGVIYVLERGETIESLADLEGKEVLSAGKGATPEIVVKDLMENQGLSADSISFSPETSEVAQSIISGNADIVILPEPMVTNVLMKADDVRIALDLNQEWDQVNEDAKLITSVLVGRKGALDEIDTQALLEEYEKSIEMAKEDPAHTGQLSEEADLFPKTVAEAAIPNLNLISIQGEELKEALTGYLEILHANNPDSIGREVPGDDFYR